MELLHKLNEYEMKRDREDEQTEQFRLNGSEKANAKGGLLWRMRTRRQQISETYRRINKWIQVFALCR